VTETGDGEARDAELLLTFSSSVILSLFLSELGEPLFHIGDPRERELGTCIKGFTHSFGIWRMVTPPWCASC